MRETKVWLWREPDHRWKKRVLSHIKNSDSIETDEDIAILHCMEAEDFPESIPLTKYMLNLCKLFGIFKNERTMFLCPKDLLQAIELCLGRLSSKNVSTEIKVEDDEIVQCHKAYLEHFHLKDRDVTEKHVLCLKKFIEENNCADVWLINDKLSDQKANNNDYFNCLPNSRFLILGTPPSEVLTLIEEDLTAISAVKRLINILKKKLLKCSSDKLRLSSIETASENLKRIATKVLDIQSEQCTNTTPQVCDATLDFLHSFINYINCSNWNFDPKQILSVRYSKRTPISLPPLLGYFRSPEDDSSCDVKSVLDEESKQSSISEPPPFMSYFHHSESSSVVGTCIDSLTPSKTNFKDCFKIYDDNESIIESGVKESSRQNSICHKGRKRSILSEITNENPPEKIKKTIEKKPTKLPLKEAKASKTKNVQQGMKKEVQTKVKGSKKFKQIQGQGKITGFFIRK
ncbi:hypothetical protein HNY73_016481 [Argiope bruennichi]|uniref:PCNA-interacting partner n=1 Tax=Argiope bruennichi TaxID=94029 RepID=A0A8T0ENV4_ARGBR|nr:hypothetical protein HNY73_016481 [Argiope bruennichi]